MFFEKHNSRILKFLCLTIDLSYPLPKNFVHTISIHHQLVSPATILLIFISKIMLGHWGFCLSIQHLKMRLLQTFHLNHIKFPLNRYFHFTLYLSNHTNASIISYLVCYSNRPHKFSVALWTKLKHSYTTWL